jgi:hypothetical protein
MNNIYQTLNMLRILGKSPLSYRFAIHKKLFVYDAGVRDGTMDNSRNELHSGVRATIFGASGINILIKAISVSP